MASSATGKREPAQAVADQFEVLLRDHEEWLMKRILHYASELGYTRYTSTLEEAWRASIRGLSESLIDGVRARDFDLEIRVTEDAASDPALMFGISEAAKHRSRGVTLPMFLSLMKYYRQAYVDLIGEMAESPSVSGMFVHATDRFFDRVEIGFVGAWAGHDDDEKTRELQIAARNMTNEKNRYLTVFESLPSPALLLDPSGRIENFNEAAGRVFKLGETSGAAYYSSVGVGSVFAPLQTEAEAFLRSSESTERFERALDTNTGLRTFVVELKRMRDVSRKFAGVTVTFTDISAQKRATIEARENWALYVQLFNNMTAAVASHSLVLDEWGRPVDYVFLEVNKPFEEMTGLTREAIVGRRVTEVLPGFEDSDFDWIAAYGEVALGNEPRRFSEYSQSLGKWFDVSATPFGEMGFITVFYDVTDRFRDEDRLRQLVEERTTELERVNLTKDRFLACMSHDLRTPLNSVLGFSSMLLGGMVGELTEEQHRQIGMINSSGKHLLGLVDQLLDLARIESGKVEPSLDRFDLVAHMLAVSESMRPAADEKGLELRVKAPTGPVEAFTDRERISEIVLNLLSNAVKFTVSGEVGVALEVDDASGTARVSVSDTGPGIPAEALEVIFDEYHRLHNGHGSGGGAGLGLAISSKLARVLGGALEVQSAVDEGSTFTFSFPLRIESAD